MGSTFVQSGNDSPVTGGAVTVTPSDATTYDPALRGLYVGVSGNVAVRFADGTTATFVGLAAGTVHTIACVDRVLATGTTATSILAFRS